MTIKTEKNALSRLLYERNFLPSLNMSFVKSSYSSLIYLIFLTVSTPMILASLFGVSLSNSLTFILYGLLYHGLNGFLILSFFKEKISDNLKVPFILVTGIAYNIISFFFLSFLFLQHLIYLNIIVLLLAKIIFQFPLMEFKEQNRNSLLNTSLNIALLLVPLVFACLAYTLQTETNHHYTFQGAIASSLINHAYPYAWHLHPEVPLYYNYGYHLEMASCGIISKIPLDVLSARIYPIYSLFILASVILAFAKEYFSGKEYTGWLTLINNICVVGFGSLSTALFLIMLPSSISMVGSSTLAILFFFLLIDRIYQKANEEKHNYVNYLFIILIFFIGSMSRSAMPPILIGGLSLYMASEYLRGTHKDILIRLFVLTFFMGIAFMTSLVLVYGYFSPYTATQFLVFVKQNARFASDKNFLSSYLGFLNSIDNFLHYIFSSDYFFNLSKAIIYILLTAGYLTIGFYYQVYKWVKVGINNLERLLLFCALVGLIIWNFTTAPGASHYTFHHYASLIVGLFGANGTYLLFKDGLAHKNKIYNVLLAISIGLFGLKGYEMCRELKKGWKTVSFRKEPHYHSLPNDLLTKIKFHVANEKNAIFLSTTSNDWQDNHRLYMQMGDTPYYSRSYLDYFYLYNSPLIADRMNNIKEVIAKCNKDLGLNDDSINEMKSLFPKKDIIILVNDKIQVQPSKVNILEDMSNYKLLKINSGLMLER